MKKTLRTLKIFSLIIIIFFLLTTYLIVSNNQPQYLEAKIRIYDNGKVILDTDLKTSYNSSFSNRTVLMPLTNNQTFKIYPESVIYSLSKKAVLLVKDMGLFKLGYDSALFCDEIYKKRVRYTFLSGKLFCIINKLQKDKKIEIDTPTAVVGVRGTSFLINAESYPFKSTIIQVYEGEIEIQSQTTNCKIRKGEKAIILENEKDIYIKKIDLIDINEIKKDLSIPEIKERIEIEEIIDFIDGKLKMELKVKSKIKEEKLRIKNKEILTNINVEKRSKIKDEESW